MKKSLQRLLCCFLTVCFLCSVIPVPAFSEGEVTQPSKVSPTFTDVANVTNLAWNQTVTLTVKINNPSAQPVEVEWSSDNSALTLKPIEAETIYSAKATVTAANNTSSQIVANVTVMVNGESDTLSITIGPAPTIDHLVIWEVGTHATTAVLEHDNPTSGLNKSVELELLAYSSPGTSSPLDLTGRKIEWESNCPNNVFVDNGEVTALSKPTNSGKATITVKIDGKPYSGNTFEVTVVDALRLSVAPASLSMTTGDTENLSASITPADYDNATITWSSSNSSSVSLTTSSGKSSTVNAAVAGSSEITVTAEHIISGHKLTHTVRIPVTVTAKPIDLIDVSLDESSKKTEADINMKVGQTMDLKVYLNPNNATNPVIKWAVEGSSGPNPVATVFQNGRVTAKRGGTTKVTATVSQNDTTFILTWNLTVSEDLGKLKISTSQTNTVGNTTVRIAMSGDTQEKSTDLYAILTPNTAHPAPTLTWTADDNETHLKLLQTAGDHIQIQPVSTTGDTPVTLTLTATSPGKDPVTATCNIYITKPVTGITIKDTEGNLNSKDKPLTITMKKGDKYLEDVVATHRFQFDVAFHPDGAGDIVTWESADNRYVRVDSEGKLEAMEYSKTPIKITARCGKYSDTALVVVGSTAVTGVTISGPGVDDKTKTATVAIGSKLQLSAAVKPETATDQSVTWTVEPSNIVTITRDGQIRPLTGTAGKKVTVTATSKSNTDIKDSIVVTIESEPLSGVTIDPNIPVTLEKGKTQRFTATVVPAGADTTVLWSVTNGTSSNSANSNGIISVSYADKNNSKIAIVTGLAPGESTITATGSRNLGTDAEPNYRPIGTTASTKVTVSGITFEKTAISLAMGKTVINPKTLFGAALYLNKNDWEWSSKDDTIVRVNPSTGQISGVKPGEAEVVCQNGSYSGSFKVTVSETSATVLSYKMGEDRRYGFSSKILGDIRNQCKTNLDGSDLNYVTNLSVSPSQGTLYYGYVSETNPGKGVAASDKFYYKTSTTGTARPEEVYRYAVGKPLDKLLADVTFVPAAGFSGKADISYTAVAENGKDLAGSIQITVPVASELTYNSPNGEAVRFVTNDFSTLSQTASGYPISSVRFNAPSERYGYLYYEYSGGDVYGSNINSGQRFYASSTPSLESVAFVPRAGYTGTFPITFTGWNTNGSSFTGTVRITVKTTGEGGGDISYTTLSGSRVYFDASDFQALCRTATGGKLNYIQFTALPTASGSSSSSSAVLYHGSGSGSRVGTSASIYVSSSGSRWTIDNVYLLPSSSYTGQVTIPFKGWDTDRKTFEGTIVVDVTKDGGTAATIYMTCTGMPLVFRRADFDDACKDALPAALKSVRFKLPGSNSGTLYERFKDLNDRKPLAANQDIPAADLVTLSYLPKGESSGTVYLSYTATDEKGNVCDGQVRITAEPNTVSLFFVDLDNTVWAIPSINFLHTYDVVKGKGKKRFQPNDTLKRGDFVLMLARAFNFQLNGSASFPDVPRNSYYAGAIAAAKSLGLVKGAGQNGSFRPEDKITRQEAATILYRVLQREQNLSAADLGYLTAFSDAGQIDTYAQTALATLIRDGVFEGSSGRLYPYSPLTRAQMAVILHRAIT